MSAVGCTLLVVPGSLLIPPRGDVEFVGPMPPFVGAVLPFVVGVVDPPVGPIVRLLGVFALAFDFGARVSLALAFPMRAPFENDRCVLALFLVSAARPLSVSAPCRSTSP